MSSPSKHGHREHAARRRPVLVHGGFLGSWSWTEVTADLRHRGFILVCEQFLRDNPEVVYLPSGHCPNCSVPALVSELLAARIEQVNG